MERKKKRDREGKVVYWCVNERKLERGGNSWRMREKEWGDNKTLNFFRVQIMKESFTRST